MAQSRKTIESVWAAKGNLPDSAIVATSDGKYPALDGSLITGIAGAGDMNASVYDPNTVAADAFARANHTGTQAASTISDFDTEVSNNTSVAANTSKLSGIAAGATANSADATLLARANHTGTQTASTISDFDTEVSNNTTVAANTLKVTYPSADSTKLAGIAEGAEVNTIESILEAGMDNDAVVSNVVSVSQADYNAGTKIGTTLYIIT